MTQTRKVGLVRTGHAQFTATNARGGTLEFGDGSDDRFTPVELLLTAIAGCTGIDVDFITTRRAEPDRFELVASGRKVSDDGGNRLTDLQVTFDVVFPTGSDGDAARERMPAAVERSHKRLCTVSRTVELGTPIAVAEM